MSPERKQLPHETPSWVKDGAIYFITICTTPRRKNQLCHDGIATRLWESLSFREDRGDWWLHLVLFMPDHLHALMSFGRETRMQHAITEWKRYVARLRGIEWQRDFFEHRLRNDENHVEKARYIRMNPVRAGLAARPEDWPYVWSKGL
ncbi:MAG: transposase [bacterium]